MKKIHKVLKISAKKSFNTLRKKQKFPSKALSTNIFISRQFWDHINFSKFRSLEEIVIRLSIIPILPEIILNGFIYEIRNKNEYGIAHYINGLCFVIIIKKTPKQFILLSCFLSDKDFVSPFNGNSSQKAFEAKSNK